MTRKKVALLSLLVAILSGCGGIDDDDTGGNGGSGSPSISAVSGTIAHGSALTLRGSGFGRKAQAAPAVFWQGESADLRGLSLQDNYLSIVDAPSVTGQKRGQESFNIRFNPGPLPAERQFVAGFSYEENAPAWFIQYWIMLDPDWHWGTDYNTDPRWANTKIFRMWTMPSGSVGAASNVLSAVSAGAELYSGTESYGTDGSKDPSNRINGWPGTLPGTQGAGTAMSAGSQLPAGTLCIEVDLVWEVTVAGTCGASKPLSQTDGFVNSRHPKIGDTVNDNGVAWKAISSLHNYWTTDGTYATYYYNTEKMINHEDFYSLMTPGVWHQIQIEYRESSGNNKADGRLHMWLDGKKYLTHDAFITSWACDGAYLPKGPALIGFYDSWSDSEMARNPSYVWMQDVYVDTSWARVEIGDNALYDSCTHRELQTISSWGDGAVAIKFNQGSFASGTQVYVFVVDSAGNRNAVGYPLTIGGQ